MNGFFTRIIIGFVLLSLGGVLTIFEVFNYEYMGEKRYLNVKTKEKTYNFDFNSKEYHIIDNNLYNVEIEIDESLSGEFKMVLKYPYLYMDIDIKEEALSETKTEIRLHTMNVNGFEFNFLKDLVKNVLTDLKNHKLYSYSEVIPTLTIYVSSANKDMIDL